MAPKGQAKGGQGQDGANNLAQFKYTAMSNLVLQADRRFVSRRSDEATGDPESLAGRISVGDMGSRNLLERGRPQKPSSLGAVKTANRQSDMAILQKQQKKGAAPQRGISGAPIQAELEIEGLNYLPRTSATRATFELITTIVAQKLGEVPDVALRSAADAVLEFLKDEELKDFDKKAEIEDILGVTLTPKEFNELLSLSKKITDYGIQEEDERVIRIQGKDNDAEDVQGVAVDFDSDAGDDDPTGPTFEVESADESDSEVGADDEGAADSDAEAKTREIDVEDELMIGADPAGIQASEASITLVPAYEIDSYWLAREIGKYYEDPHVRQEKATDASTILNAFSDADEDKPLRELENELMELFDYENHELVQKLILHRDKIVWATRWFKAGADEEAQAVVERQMVAAGHRQILVELQTRQAASDGNAATDKKFKIGQIKVQEPINPEPTQGREGKLIGGLQPKKVVDLESLAFSRGNHVLTATHVNLPEGTTRRVLKSWEEIRIKAPTPKHSANEPPDKLTSDLPAWARIGFGSSQKLNRIQTACYPTAFESDENMLICAPTGSGKTNVAMLTMLREIGKHRDPHTGNIMLDDFKIVYIAPLKALVQEQVGNFGTRLAHYGITVAELTGDRQLTKEQITNTQVIVTTPEKWDVITRKASDTSYTNLVRLICVDEIHLLHDDRGPVLESIVSRTIRQTERSGEPVRLVGLSATLPNYKDVADFLRVDPEVGLFHFDGSYRPCPLRQEYIGITEKKAIKALKAQNQVCYEKVLEHVGENNNQMLIFVHSRKETAKTAKFIRDLAVENGTIGRILRNDAASRQILKEEAETVKDADLRDLLPYGFAIHHAGMDRPDRTSVEDLFADGAIQVIVCTATLAWGVNLPAHTVIIKGTQIYSPEKGGWVELSPQDVLQMLGRAGRPQYDTYGEGIIITGQNEVQYYLALLNQQLPIESQLMSKLPDALNAEIVLGNVRSRDEAVNWLEYTYLYVRMLHSPGLYGITEDYDDDVALEQRRVDLIHSAATVLEKCELIKYDKKTGRLQSTELGRIASHYYVAPRSMFTYNQQLAVGINDIEFFRIFSLSDEFRYIPVRQDEKVELAQLINKVPIPVKETVEEPAAKINVLFQAYISRLKLDGLALMADLVYVIQSAGRILRAIFEICLKKGYADTSTLALNFCKQADRRMWKVLSPLRQFGDDVGRDIIAKAERINVRWERYFDLDPPRMGELLGMPKVGRQICALVERFPRLDLNAVAVPITPSMLRIDLTITPNFIWEDKYHGATQSFWILCKDSESEQLLFHDQFLLRKEFAKSENNEHHITFTVPIFDPKPPYYFIHVMSDRWVKSETKLVLMFNHLEIPTKFPPHTKMLDLQLMPVSALPKPEYRDLYPNWDMFNQLQTNVFQTLYDSDESVFIGASTGNGKTVCAEFALLHFWEKSEFGKAVYLAPLQEMVDSRFQDWQKRLSSIGGEKEVIKLSGDMAADLRSMAQADLILATPQQWDQMSRPWQRRKVVQTVELLIADDVHLINHQDGDIYEAVVTRMATMAATMETNIRMIGLSVSLANGRDIGSWMGVKKENVFNFKPSIRAVPLELHIQSYNIPHFPSLMLAMARPTYHAIVELSPDKPAIVFVPSRKQARTTALDLLAACNSAGDENRFLNSSFDDMKSILSRINERALAESLKHGIGYFHEALDDMDKRLVSRLFQIGAIQVLLVSRDCCWELDLNAHLVVVMGTQYFDGREHRYVDYELSEVLQMFGKAGRVGGDKLSKGVLMVPGVKREFYKKFLNEGLPVESQLHLNLHDAFVPEVGSGNVSSLQEAVDWTTYTYFYRRLDGNPSFYGLKDGTMDSINEWLSSTVETTLKELAEAGMVELDEEDDSLSITTTGAIADYHNISFITMQTLNLSLTGKSKHKAIMEIVTAAHEFERIQIRRHEEHLLRRIYDRVPVKLVNPDFSSPTFKAFVLLQAHFSRTPLPVDLAKDKEMVLRRVPTLLAASADVLSGNGHLNALQAMEMSQMVVQAMWDHDTPLMQIEHFGEQQLKACAKFGVEDIFGFMDAMDPDGNPDYDKFVQALDLSEERLREVAEFTNNVYPNVQMSFELLDKDGLTTDVPSHLSVTIERQIGEDEEPITQVHAPYYPGSRTEGWWLVVGEEKTKSLLGIKRVTLGRGLNVKLEFTPNAAGKREYTLYLMSDCYVGIDQAPTFSVDVAEGMDEEEDAEAAEETPEEMEVDESE